MATGHIEDRGEGTADRGEATAPSPARRAGTLFDTSVKRLSAAAGAIIAIAGVPVALHELGDKQDKAGFAQVRLATGMRLSDYRVREESEYAAVRRPASSGGALLAAARPAVVWLAQAGTTDATDTDGTDTGTDTGAADSGTPEGTRTDTGATGTDTTPTDTGSTDTTPTEPTVTGADGGQATTGPEPAGEPAGDVPEGDTTDPATGHEAPKPPDRKGATILSPTVPVLVPRHTTPARLTARIGAAARAASRRAHVTSCAGESPGGLPCPAMAVLATAASTDPFGKLIPEQRTKQRLIGLLRDTRTVGVGQGREPIGAEVTSRVDLTGLRGKDVYVRWQIRDAGSHRRLFGGWLATNVAYRLKVDSDDTSRIVNIWVPEPRRRGRYFVRMYVTSGGAYLSYTDTRVFR